MTSSTDLANGQSIQERYFAEGKCFGCGPANDVGLKIRSFPRAEGLVAEWQPRPEHEAFPDVLCGGIIGTLLDCHSNWTAWWTLLQRDGIERPMTLTASYEVKLRPTPLDRPVALFAEPVDVSGDRVRVEARLESGGRASAECRGLFVRPPKRPAK
ncbi:MAG: PaaI family thioesterase [Actinomycetota bacterium]|nr:PaaI family thioesterase [Actinomycetota bacterium]